MFAIKLYRQWTNRDSLERAAIRFNKYHDCTYTLRAPRAKPPLHPHWIIIPHMYTCICIHTCTYYMYIYTGICIYVCVSLIYAILPPACFRINVGALPHCPINFLTIPLFHRQFYRDCNTPSFSQLFLSFSLSPSYVQANANESASIQTPGKSASWTKYICTNELFNPDGFTLYMCI